MDTKRRSPAREPVTGPTEPSFLSTRAGVLTLLLLCAVQFLDVVDGSIVNVALPSIEHSLRFSQQNLQWVATGYVLTYGGFLLLGGRAADLLGRRRMLVAGVVVFAACSLVAGLARSETTLIGARLAQGVGAALMAPAALSLIATRRSASGAPSAGWRRPRASSSAACSRKAPAGAGSSSSTCRSAPSSWSRPSGCLTETGLTAPGGRST
jgi:MFS family permease